MLVAAAVCPHPPLLVPQLAAGAAAELDELRTTCRTVVGILSSSPADVLYVVGADIGLRATSFAPWGQDEPVDVPEPLPLPVLVGAWLTRGRARSFVVVDPELPPSECASVGAELAASAADVALLVMGDGSARHHEKAPGYLDPRATQFDASVARALAAGDLTALRGLDAAVAAELLVAGRAPWQVLAGAAGDTPPAVRLASFDAPYGVGYHVAAWTWP